MDYALHIIDPIDDPHDDNCDVQVTLPDGRSYRASFFTVKNVTTLMRRWATTGEYGGGLYFSVPNTIIVERLDEATFRAVVENILEEEGRLTTYFDPVVSKAAFDTGAVDRFVATAREFCEMIEERHDLRNEDCLRATRPTDILRIVRPSLLALYAAGLDLPVVHRDGDGDRVTDVSEAEWRQVCSDLVGLLGEYRYYRTAHGFPLADGVSSRGDESLLTGDLADDLADIYRDVRAGLNAWDAGEPEARREALWYWKFHFDSHYDQHLVEAIAAIQRLPTMR